MRNKAGYQNSDSNKTIEVFEKDGNGNVMIIGSLIDGEYIVNDNLSNV